MTAGCEWRHAPEACAEDLGDLRKVSELSLASEEDGWLSGLAEALQRVPHVVWSRWKSRHRKIVPFSSLCRKSFNSKVIKSFVPELRSRKCLGVFLCFGIPMLSIYELWTFYVHFTYPYHGYVTLRLADFWFYTKSTYCFIPLLFYWDFPTLYGNNIATSARRKKRNTV